MSISAACPTCSRKLRVPDDLLGKLVKCPSCGSTFTANEGAPPPPLEERPASRRPLAPPDEDDGDDDEPRSSRRRKRSRGRYLEPHRGPLILVLGILSLVTGGALILGPIAWILGNNDLAAIRAGRMDPEGESATNAGRICGMIATILGIVSVVCTLFGCVIWVIMMGAMAGAAGSHNGPPF